MCVPGMRITEELDFDNSWTSRVTPPQHYIDSEDQFYVYYDIYRTTYVIIIDTLVHSILYREHVPFIGMAQGTHRIS